MPLINALSVNIGQATDIKAVKSSSSASYSNAKEQGNNSFSRMMEKHTEHRNDGNTANINHNKNTDKPLLTEPKSITAAQPEQPAKAEANQTSKPKSSGSAPVQQASAANDNGQHERVVDSSAEQQKAAQDSPQAASTAEEKPAAQQNVGDAQDSAKLISFMQNADQTLVTVPSKLPVDKEAIQSKVAIGDKLTDGHKSKDGEKLYIDFNVIKSKQVPHSDNPSAAQAIPLDNADKSKGEHILPVKPPVTTNQLVSNTQQLAANDKLVNNPQLSEQSLATQPASLVAGPADKLVKGSAAKDKLSTQAQQLPVDKQQGAGVLAEQVKMAIDNSSIDSSAKSATLEQSKQQAKIVDHLAASSASDSAAAKTASITLDQATQQKLSQLAQVNALQQSTTASHKLATNPLTISANQVIHNATQASVSANDKAQQAANATTDQQTDVTLKNEQQANSNASDQRQPTEQHTKQAAQAFATGQKTVMSAFANVANEHVNHSTDNGQQQGIAAMSNKLVEHNNQIQKTDLVALTNAVTVQRKDFANDVKDKVMVMIQHKIQQADIRLDPPELGSMHIKVHMHNDQAMVSFVVQNQHAKDALDQNMSKFKDMLANSGVNIGDTSVEHQERQTGNDQQQSQTSSGQAFEPMADDGDLSTQVFSANVVKGSATGVDYYV